MRDIILLACENCQRRNYSTTKNKKNMAGKFEIKKYCKFCQGRYVHKETKA